MLFDGAVRFGLAGARCIRRGDVAGKGEKLVRAQAIVHELQALLDHDVAPELCASLAALYGYVAELLVRANLDADATAVEEAVGLLRTVRAGFAEAGETGAGAGDEEPAAQAAG